VGGRRYLHKTISNLSQSWDITFTPTAGAVLNNCGNIRVFGGGTFEFIVATKIHWLPKTSQT
jgi:hypothetical protein